MHTHIYLSLSVHRLGARTLCARAAVTLAFLQLIGYKRAARRLEMIYSFLSSLNQISPSAS